MKNGILFLLVLGLLVSLYFNLKPIQRISVGQDNTSKELLSVVLRMNMSVDDFILMHKSGKSSPAKTEINTTINEARDILDELKNNSKSQAEQSLYSQVSLLLESQVKMMNFVLNQQDQNYK